MSKQYLRSTKNLYCDYVNGYQVYYSYNTAVGVRFPNNDLLEIFKNKNINKYYY